MRRALAIDEQSYGQDHPNVARDLNNLAQLLQDTNRLSEAGPLYRRALSILISFQKKTGHEHPNFRVIRANYMAFLQAMGKTPDQIEQHLQSLVEGRDPAGS